MKINLVGFAGELPKIDRRLLPDTHAFQCSAARLNTGSLSAMREDTVATTLPASGTRRAIYLYNGTWIAQDSEVDAAPGPVADDRLYMTIEGQPPVVSVSGTEYPLAVPTPPTGPLVTLPTDVPADNRQTTFYVYTWVTSLDEESLPSPKSNTVSIPANYTVSLGSFAAVPPDRLIDRIRIYRAVTSLSGTTDLFFVKEVSAATTTTTHNLQTAPVQEVLPSKDYDPPPSDLVGLTAMPNGIMAAFTGRDLYFCEPYRPHAWPVKYSLRTDSPIVGLCAMGTSLAVMTKRQPYIVQGLHPDSMTMTRIEVNLPCVARRSIVDMGYAAIYASTESLVQISEQGAVEISKGVWERDQWQALAPSTFRAAQYQGRYVFCYNPVGAAGNRVMTFDPSGQTPFVIPDDSSFYMDMFLDIESGQLYGLRPDRRTIVAIDPPTGRLRQYRWASKTFAFQVPVSFATMIAEGLPAPKHTVPVFQMRVIADGKVVGATSVCNEPARIEPVNALLWQIELRGNWNVARAAIAQSNEELLS